MMPANISKRNGHMYRGDKGDMIEENIAIVRKIVVGS